MTNKIQTFTAAIAAGLFEFVAWFVMIPPEQQTEYIHWFMEFLPLTWRDDIGIFSKFISRAAAIWALFAAAKSGPATKPTNPANPTKL